MESETNSEVPKVIIKGLSYKKVMAIIGMSALAAMGVSIASISYFDYRAGQRFDEADRDFKNNIDYAARIGDCLLDNSRVVSAEASQRFIADANQKASELLDNKVAKPLENATGPLTDLSRVVPTTTTTAPPTPTSTEAPAIPANENAASPPPTEPPATTTSISIPEHLPACSDIPVVVR